MSQNMGLYKKAMWLLWLFPSYTKGFQSPWLNGVEKQHARMAAPP